MRWLSRAPRQATIPDRIDLATLEVVELDTAGRPVGPPSALPAAQPREIAYAPRDRDPTGVSGVWEAIAGS